MTTTGLRLFDLLKGTSVLKTKRFLETSQHWELEELKAFQEEKLQKLLEGVLRDVPFYGDYKTLRQKDHENWSIERLGDWPILDRTMVMEAGDKLLSTEINLKKCKIGRTGGTTGPPLRLYRDVETRSWALAAYYRFYDWMGIEPGMPEAELWGSSNIRNPKLFRPSLHAPGTFLFKKINRFKSFNAFLFNEQYLEAVANDFKKHKPKLIRGYLSAILLLADYIRRNNVKGINPVAVSSTSETVFPEYRKKIEEIFQAPLYNQYGCGECNSIAFECNEHNGMHITMEHCILESVENDHLVVTNLDNYSQPFIRYKNGDIGKISHEACACGNMAPRLIDLQGRASENVILKDDASANGIFFANLLDQAGFINSDKMLRFQVVQNKAGEIEFKAEVKRQMEKKDLKILYDALKPFFNKIEISQHQFIDPGPTGKFRYIVSGL